MVGAGLLQGADMISRGIRCAPDFISFKQREVALEQVDSFQRPEGRPGTG